MYTAFYGLREKPFALSPDPRFLYLAGSHREALAHLLYGIDPQGAVPEVKAICRYISHKNGGEGCVRDIIEQVLKVRNDWHGNYDAKA